MPIVEAIAAVSQALTVVKGMRAVEKSFDAATYKIQIADLMTALSDAKLELVAARDAATAKEVEFESLKKTLAGQAELVDGRGGFKYRANGDGQPSGLRVCPTCEQRDGRLTFTVKDDSPRKVRCPVCTARFDGVAIYSTPPANEPVTLEEDQNRRAAEGMARLTDRMSRGIY